MAVRFILGALGVAVLGIASGCGFGPINDRLYEREWKAHREHPMKIKKDFVYEGEHWEHFVWEKQ